MASRVVRPETKRVTISDGDWLLLKKRLNHGEQQEAFARKYVADVVGSRLNLRLVGMDRVLAFLVDWSLTGLDDQVIEIRGKSADEVEAALNSIDPQSFAEIKTAVEQHELAMDVERATVKNAKAGENGSAAISPSPSAAAGPLTTSEA
jgi:hypothetical protein